MAKPPKPAARLATASGPVTTKRVAAFDPGDSRSYIIPVDTIARPGANPKAAGGAKGPQIVGEFEYAGRRYQVAECAIARHHSAERPAQADPTQFLTARELQIVRLVCFGNVNKQIACQLKISEYTVKTYLKQIFMKLQAHNRSAVVFQCAAWVGACVDGIDAQRTSPRN